MENIYLEQNDEFFGVVDKIKNSHDLGIVLFVPVGIAALKSIINLRILKKESNFAGKSLSISTSDPLIKRLAQQVGIKTLNEGEEFGAKGLERQTGRVVDLRSMSDIVVSKKKEEALRPEPVEPEINYFYKKKPQKEKTFSEPLPIEPEKPEKKEKFKFFTRKFFIRFFIVAGLVGLFFVGYFVLPRAQVVITPKREKVQFESEILADKKINSVNSEESTIPGQYFELEKTESREFPTTGERDVLEKAKGRIIVYNQYSSSPQSLVKTTRFRSTDNKIFRLTSTVTIPGAIVEEGKIIASSKEVEVEADEAGPAYNIGPSDFTIPGFEGTPKYAAFYGKSTDAMAGGAKGKMKVATESDIKGATDILVLELKTKTQKEFQEKVPNNLKLLEGAQRLEVVQSSSSLKANQPGEKVTIIAKVKASGLAFKEEDAIFLLQSTVNEKISKGKTLLLSTVKIDYIVSVFKPSDGLVDLLCKVAADAVWNFDEQKIKSNLAGKNEEEVKRYLSSLPEIELAKVIFWPFWVNKVPSNKNRIKVINKVD